jgi:hypothetical protein
VQDDQVLEMEPSRHLLAVQVEKVYWPMVEVTAFYQTNWRNFAGKARLKMKITDSENEI